MTLENKLGNYSCGKTEDNLNVISNSPYNLVTKICEKLLNSQPKSRASNKFIKRCRSRAFEILLSKKVPEQVEEFVLENNNDPYCYLLAWQFLLMSQYHLIDHAHKLQKCLATLQKSTTLDEKVLSDILHVLVKLRKLPEQNNVLSIHSMNSSTLEIGLNFRYFDSAQFKLSAPMICTGTKFNNQSFLLPTKRNIKKYEYLRSRFSESDVCKNCHVPLRISCSSSECIINEEDEYKPASIEEPFDIWELASKTEFTKHRTWETLGNPHPNKEPPFLTEAPSSVCSSLYMIHYSNIFQLLGEKYEKFQIITDQKNFICHVKLLLVGIISNSFKRDEKNEMYLVPGTTIEGISPLAMESYCKDFTLCSYCYSALDSLCNFHSPSKDYQCQGFIFKEFCDGINRYLAYYRLAIQNISVNSNLLNVHNYIKPLLSHLTVLASICKVGPFRESGQLPNGVALLNYLYQKTTELTNKNVIMVLYSSLYACIQIYFYRFLQQWVFEGMVNDPYGEFFIVSNSSYLLTRSRTYWTRSHAVRVDMVPDFLADLCQDIFLCGKTMNLLKLCVPNSPLCMYLMGKKPNLLSCCLNSDQVQALERNSACYYFEVMAECGTKFQISNVITKTFEQHSLFLDLVAKKRAATLKRLQLEKLKEVEEEVERKQGAMAELKRQYDEALQSKKSQIIKDIEKEMESNEKILKLENLRRKLIAVETSDLIEYYEKLNAISEKRRQDIQKHVDNLKKIDLDSSTLAVHGSSNETISNVGPHGADQVELLVSETKSADSSNESFQSANSEFSSGERKEGEEFTEQIANQSATQIHSSASLDVINANSEICPKISEVAQIAAENFEMARRNKAKVLNEEMGISQMESKQIKRSKSGDISINLLSDLEKNRLKVMSSEFDVHTTSNILPKKTRELTICEINKQKVMSSNECFRMQIDEPSLKGTISIENKLKIASKTNINNGNTSETHKIVENNGTTLISSYCNNNYNVYLENNGNINTILNQEENGNNTNENVTETFKVEEKNVLNKSLNDNFKSSNLTLDFSKLTNMQQNAHQNSESIFSKFLRSPNFEFDKPIPMSLDSTPCVDSATPKIQSSIATEQFEYEDSAATTAATNFTDEGFRFENLNNVTEPQISTQKQFNDKVFERMTFSKRVSVKDASNIFTGCTKIFIQQSVLIPLNTHISLVNNELLKYIFCDLRFVTHLNNLRNYFFLLDGEFGRNITEGLFSKLYEVNSPMDIINCRTLQQLICNAIDSSIKIQEYSEYLSFKINNMPNEFKLEDPDVLQCLSLTYKVSWPLNILLPSDTVSKYDEVFRFLMKVNRVSWVLKKILQELKLFSKKSGKNEPYLIISPQFQKIHQRRHVMTHFVQTLQNYVVGEISQTSWDSFKKKLISVNHIDEIYVLHVAYVKDILFMCLLNQRSLPIRKLILRIFTVILKYYNYLRVCEWEFNDDDCVYTHTNFKKLEEIFRNFEEFIAYFVKAAHKAAKVGYQPHLIQLLEILNVNDYYTNKNAF